MLEWPSEDSVTVPARGQHVAGLGKVLWEALPALNQSPIYGSVSPTASIHGSRNQGGSKQKWHHRCHSQLCVCASSRQSCRTLCNPMDWRGLSLPPPGDLPDPEIKPTSPAWQADSLLLSHLGSPQVIHYQFLLPVPEILCSAGPKVFIPKGRMSYWETMIPMNWKLKPPLATLGTTCLWINRQRRELPCWWGWPILTPRGNWTTTP